MVHAARHLPIRVYGPIASDPQRQKQGYQSKTIYSNAEVAYSAV